MPPFNREHKYIEQKGRDIEGRQEGDAASAAKRETTHVPRQRARFDVCPYCVWSDMVVKQISFYECLRLYCGGSIVLTCLKEQKGAGKRKSGRRHVLALCSLPAEST